MLNIIIPVAFSNTSNDLNVHMIIRCPQCTSHIYFSVADMVKLSRRCLMLPFNINPIFECQDFRILHTKVKLPTSPSLKNTI